MVHNTCLIHHVIFLEKPNAKLQNLDSVRKSSQSACLIGQTAYLGKKGGKKCWYTQQNAESLFREGCINEANWCSKLKCSSLPPQIPIHDIMATKSRKFPKYSLEWNSWIYTQWSRWTVWTVPLHCTGPKDSMWHIMPYAEGVTNQTDSC